MERIELFGCSIISETSPDVVAEEVIRTKTQIEEDANPIVYTANIYNLVLNNYWYLAIFKELQKSAFVLPDGFPVVLTSRLKRTPLASRITGADLFKSMWKRLKAEKNERALFICSYEEIGQKLCAEYELASYYTPPFFNFRDKAETGEVIERVVAKIKDNKPSYVFMGIGEPNQQHLGIEVLNRLKQEQFQSIPLFLYFGASLEFYLGLRKRAPEFYQKWGLEWFYRFANEPRKLFYRYFVLSWLFIPIMLKEIVTKGSEGSK